MNINVCGSHSILHSSQNSSNYEFDLEPDGYFSLSRAGNLTTNLTELFDNSDPFCSWTSFNLTEFDKVKKEFVPFEDKQIKLDTVKRDIFV